MTILLNRTFQVVASVIFIVLIHDGSAHEGILPHSHAAEPGNISPLVFALILAAIVALISSWRLFRSRRWL